MNLQRLITIVKKEFIHITRDKASLVISLMMPVMLTFLLGYAVNTDVDHIPTAVLDMDQTAQSREVIDKFRNSDYFNINTYLNSTGELEELMDKGKVGAAIIIPSGFDKQMKRNEKASLQFIVDGTDPTIARTALQSGLMLGEMYSLTLQKDYMEQKGFNYGSAKGLDIRSRVWYNPNLESSKFTIPGLIGLIIQNITVMLTAFSLVREKEKGTIELLVVTPIKPGELVLGKMIPYVLIGAIDFLITLFFGTLWFHVPIEGSITLLIILGLGFVICSLAIGMLISTIAQTQAQAMQMTLLFLLPSVLLSGFVFPRAAMPQIIQMAGYFIPLTYFVEILRGIILKGVGISYLWNQVAVLTLLGTILLTVASLRFKKKLD